MTARRRKKKKRVRTGGGPGMLVTVGIALVAAIVGIALGPILAASFLTFLPNPKANEVEDLQTQLAEKQKTIDKFTQGAKTQGEQISQEEINKLIEKRDQLNAEIETLAARQSQDSAAYQKLLDDLAAINQDIEDKNQEYIAAQEEYEVLVNEMQIVQARHVGLLAEVERLTDRVGKLEDANTRRLATKEALEHCVERLAVVIKEGIPLTPEKYSRASRMAAAESLQTKAAGGEVGDPRRSLKPTRSSTKQRWKSLRPKSYFFANLPVTDKFGSPHLKWAECLMIGNWAVYYRTLDGKHIGTLRGSRQYRHPQLRIPRGHRARSSERDRG